MQSVRIIFFLLFSPLSLLAQDTTFVKQQANILAQAAVNGDYKTIVDHMYPRLVTLVGGKEKMATMAGKSMEQLKSQGVAIESAGIGSPGKFYKAGAEIHCLIPETTRLKLPRGHAVGRSYLLAITSDEGKHWSFIDLNKSTIGALPKLFPHFNHSLIVPELAQPVLEP